MVDNILIADLAVQIAALPGKIADQALEEYERTSGHNEAITAIFAIGAEIRSKKKPCTICR